MCSSSTSKPALTRILAVSTYALVIRVRSFSVADLTICMDSGLGIRLALTARTPLERPLATGPAWPTWPAIAAPVWWIASAIRVRPGRSRRPTRICSRWVRPSGATAR